MSTKTWTVDQLIGRAMADRVDAYGRVFAYLDAQIGDGGDLWDKQYGRKGPLFVRVTRRPLHESDVRVERRERLIDTYWDVEPLPGQLSPGEHVSWVYGPTYHFDGSKTRAPVCKHPLADFLNSLSPGDLDGLIAFVAACLPDLYPVADRLEELGGDRKWCQLFTVRS